MSKNNTEIACNNLEIGYRRKEGKFSVAGQINFKCSQGNLVGIVGVNGVGKSTLLRTISGIQPALSGQVTLNARLIRQYSNKELSKILSVVLTDPLATKNLSVFELVSLGRQPYTNWLGSLSDSDKEKVDEVLQRLEIAQLSDKKCYQLSDGQLQKVLLARALAQDTSVVILDEPTTHLDLYHKVQILKLLRNAAHDLNKLVIFSTHEIELSIQLCDQLYVMQESSGSFGTPEELVASGNFSSLFPEGALTFDKNTGTFTVVKDAN